MKLEQAARQALNWIDANAPRYVFEAIEEALAEPQITTPDVCGEVCARAKLCYGCNKNLEEANAKLAEQAWHEPVAWLYKTERKDFANNRGLMFTKNSALKGVDWIPLYSEPVKSVEQEPVVKIHKYNEFQTLGSLNLPIGTKLYAAPVRTKDLTDDEVAKAYMECTGGDIIARCRAVIAADREKNK